jgi:hypothetical protein
MFRKIGVGLATSVVGGIALNQKKNQLDLIALNENRVEFETLLSKQSKESPKFTREFTNGIFHYMNRQMQHEGYDMADNHLAVLKKEIDRDSGLWYKLFAENSTVVSTQKKEGFTPVFVMGQFFHWSFVEKVKPVFYEED